MPHSIFASVSGASSVLFGLATAVLLFVLAITLTNDHQPINVLAFLAAGLQLVSQVTLSYLVWVQNTKDQGFSFRAVEGTRRVRQFRVVLPSIILCVLSGGASLATFIWTEIRLQESQKLFLGREDRILFLSSSIIWLISILAQVVFYVFILSLKRHRNETNGISHEVGMSYPDSQEMDETSRPGTALTDQTNTHDTTQDWSSQPPTPRNAETTSSLRSSITIAVRPSASKTRLLAHKKSYHRDPKMSTSASSPSSRLSQDSAFDNWDTSSVAPQIRETVHQSSPIVRGTTALTPIPGSRSPSPAKALEGPFFFPIPPGSSSSNPSTSLLPNYSRPVTRQRSASSESYSLPQRSFSIPEEHIHPLFRTNSPTPPPSATPGTTVTAAPGSFSGLVMNERALHLHRMRSGSLPSSPSPLGLSTPFFDAVETISAEGEAGRRGS